MKYIICTMYMYGRDDLRPPHGTTRAAVKNNKLLKRVHQKQRTHSKEKKHEPYLEVSAIQASSVIMKISVAKTRPRDY